MCRNIKTLAGEGLAAAVEEVGSHQPDNGKGYPAADGQLDPWLAGEYYAEQDGDKGECEAAQECREDLRSFHLAIIAAARECRGRQE